MTGLLVSSDTVESSSASSGVHSTLRADLPSSSASRTRLKKSSSSWYFLSALSIFCVFSMRRSSTSISERINSRLMVSISRFGSMLPSTWTMSSLTKQRTTCTMASTSRILARNLFPRPSPLLAPRTSPAMSTNSMVAGVYFSGWYISASLSSRWSGTATTPIFGSMVQNG